MFYRICSIICHILTSIAVMIFAACIVYTVASPVVQQSINSIGKAVDGLVNDATATLTENGIPDPTGVIETGTSIFGDFIDGLLGIGQGSANNGAAGQGMTFEETYRQVVSSGSGSGVVVADFSDPAQGQAYLGWKNAVGNPVDRVLAGTPITSDVIIGVAGGSNNANGVLLALDDETLDAISTNIFNYSKALATVDVPSVLPANVQKQIAQANAAAQEFCTRAQDLVTGIRNMKTGSILAYGELANAANGVWQNDQIVEQCMQTAEKLLGVR
ncbi:MAG: hypothetical protein IKE43_05215 [Coriobacteriales bacterium]|nr:hypothetical protein [Coriobacteriales bacterium]